MSEWPKTIKYYLHGDRDTNFEIADEIGLSDEATGNFKYCCYELELTLEVNEDGTAYISAIGEHTLPCKVSVA